MRWIAVFVLLAGCVRARMTVVHPTNVERTSGGRGATIARVDPAGTADPVHDAPQPAEAANRVSVELGALVPFGTVRESTRIYLAPGARIFGGDHGSVLWGVSVGADFANGRGPGLAVEGSVHAGDSSSDTQVIEQALDVFAGVTLRADRLSSTVAIGPSFGVLGLPGGHSVLTIGLALRVGTK